MKVQRSRKVSPTLFPIRGPSRLTPKKGRAWNLCTNELVCVSINKYGININESFNSVLNDVLQSVTQIYACLTCNEYMSISLKKYIAIQ